MSRAVPLSDLIERAALLADDQLLDAFTHTQYVNAINEAIEKLWDRLIDSGVPPDLANHDIATTGAFTYALATDHARILAVQKLGTDSRPEYVLKPLSMADWAAFDIEGGQQATRYYPHPETGIHLLPQPPSGQTYRVWYVPDPPVLADDPDTISLTIAATRFICTDVAIQVRIKEQSEHGDIRKERAESLAEIIAHSGDRVLESLMLARPRETSEARDPADYFPRRSRW